MGGIYQSLVHSNFDIPLCKSFKLPHPDGRECSLICSSFIFWESFLHPLFSMVFDSTFSSIVLGLLQSEHWKICHLCLRIYL